MNVDVVEKNRDLRRFGEPNGFDGFFWAALSALLVLSLAYFQKAAGMPDSGIARQAALAAQIRFSDPAGIWRLSAYPVWHIGFAAVYKLGAPFAWAAAAVTTAFLTLGFAVTQRVIRLHLGAESSPKLATLGALAAVLASALRVPFLSAAADAPPALWRDPTLATGFAASLLCLFYAAHCLFGLREAQGGEGPALPWRRAGILAALLLLSALSHPAFVWAFLPAVALYALAFLIKHRRLSRSMLRMSLALLPAAACAAGQLAASGVSVSASLGGVFIALRDLLFLAAFPLIALLLLPRRETFRDPVIRLSLLALAAGGLEAALAAGGDYSLVAAALPFWVVMLPRFIDQIFVYRYEKLRLQEDARRGAVATAALARARGRLNLRSLGFLIGLITLLWQGYTGIYGLYRFFLM